MYGIQKKTNILLDVFPGVSALIIKYSPPNDLEYYFWCILND